MNSMKTITHLLSAVAVAMVFLLPSPVQAEKIKLLIIDGQNNHNWAGMTPVNKKTLESTGLFTVDVSTTPPKKSKKEEWKDWRPDFSKYDVLLSNYNGDRWPAEVEESFVEYVRNGGGLVIIHAADNSFPDWTEYNEMIGVGGWGGRNEKSGPYVRYRNGKVELDTSPGRGGSHGPKNPFLVVARNADHPIMKGLPTQWMHAKDELYDSLRGPAKNLTLLATAHSKKSGEHEPMMMVLRFGKGRIFHTPMGHLMGEPEPVAIHCVGFQTVMVRGAEWAATGKVTTGVPDNFPGPGEVSIAAPEEVKWKVTETALKFKAGSCCDRAQKAGKTCGHACCKEALASGEVCQKCNS